MGSAARYASANKEAVMELPWRPHELKVLLKQWEWGRRGAASFRRVLCHAQFDWLFRAIVLDHEPLWESIQDYDEAANKEIYRKELNLVMKQILIT